MRLEPFEVDAIKNTAEKIFGKGTKVLLYGSRVDDSARGGDIDLYLIPPKIESPEKSFDKKIHFLVELKEKIGDQKIDVIIARDKTRLVEREAVSTGIEL